LYELSIIIRITYSQLHVDFHWFEVRKVRVEGRKIE